MEDSIFGCMTCASHGLLAKSNDARVMNVDIRGVLHDIRAPTLVLARPDDQLVPLDAAAALAAGIRGAQFGALPAGDHNTFDIFDLVGAQLVEFVCDTGGAATSECSRRWCPPISSGRSKDSQRPVTRTGAASSTRTMNWSTRVSRNAVAAGRRTQGPARGHRDLPRGQAVTSCGRHVA